MLWSLAMATWTKTTHRRFWSFIAAVLASIVGLVWLYINSRSLERQLEKQRPWFDFVAAGVVGTIWSLLLARAEHVAAIETIEAERPNGEKSHEAAQRKANEAQRKRTETWRFRVRATGACFSIAAAVLVIHTAFLPEAHRMLAVGSGTVIDTMLTKRDQNVCKYLDLDYIDSGSREAIPLLARRYSTRKDTGAFALMANRYESKANQRRDGLASQLTVTEFVLADYGFTPIVNRDNTCRGFERGRLLELAQGAGGKPRSWHDFQRHPAGSTVAPCLKLKDDPTVDLIVPSECRDRNSRSGTCTQLARWLSLDVLNPVRTMPESDDPVDVVKEVATRPTAIAFVTDRTLKASPFGTNVQRADVFVDAGGSVEPQKRWGLFAYLPTMEVDGQYQLADQKFLTCIVDSLRSLPDDAEIDWAAARDRQAAWLKGRVAKDLWQTRYRLDKETDGPNVFRLNCPDVADEICELADFDKPAPSGKAPVVVKPAPAAPASLTPAASRRSKVTSVKRAKSM
jgi:hypothetical protein